MTFNDLNLSKPLLDAIADAGYTHPTDIQKNAIPLVLNRHDIIGSAQTGTGKTAAFSVPIIQLLDSASPNKIEALVVTPTRELAIQIGENVRQYAKYTSIKSAVIFGGVKQNKQVADLKKGVHILIATPGRLLDLMDQGFINLNHIKYFVLDEADRMLDMGFIHDIKRIIAKLPSRRQSLFFSATMPPKIKNLSNEILHNPKHVRVNPVSSTAETITQYLYLTNKNLKHDVFLHLLKNEIDEPVLVFSRTKHGADRIARRLHKAKISSGAIHGNKSQNQRQNVLTDFKKGKVQVLVATDIAARGIDIDKLKYVINYDIPNEPETYVHRIGRCGRAGEEGVSFSICEPEENAYVDDIEALTKEKLSRVSNHPFPQTDKPLSASEKKVAEKERMKRKQEAIANRKRKQGNKNQRGRRR